MQQQTRIFLIKMDIFYSCHKTLSQEKFHKHNNNFRDNLTELPDHIYDSFLIHSQNKFAADDVSPWDLCGDSITSCSNNQLYCVLNLVYVASLETINSEANNKTKQITDSKNKRKNFNEIRTNDKTGNKAKKKVITPRSPYSRRSSSKFPFLYHGIKDINYQLPVSSLEHSHHCEAYRKFHTYEILKTFNKNRSKNLQPTLPDKNTVIARYQKKLEDQRLRIESIPPVMLLSIRNRSTTSPCKIREEKSYEKTRRCRSAKTLKQTSEDDLSFQDIEVIPCIKVDDEEIKLEIKPRKNIQTSSLKDRRKQKYGREMYYPKLQNVTEMNLLKVSKIKK